MNNVINIIIVKNSDIKSDICKLYRHLYKSDHSVATDICSEEGPCRNTLQTACSTIGSTVSTETDDLVETIRKVSELEMNLKKRVERKLPKPCMKIYTDLFKIYSLRRCLSFMSEEDRLRVLKDKYSTVKSSQPEYYYLQRRIGSYTANEIDFLRAIAPRREMRDKLQLPVLWQEVVHNKRKANGVDSYGYLDHSTRISLIGYAFDELRNTFKYAMYNEAFSIDNDDYTITDSRVYSGTINCPKLLKTSKAKSKHSKGEPLTFAELNLIFSERIGGLTESEAHLHYNLPSVNSNIPFYDVLVRHNKLKDIMEAFKNKYDPWDYLDLYLPDTQYTRRLSKEKRMNLYPKLAGRNYFQYLWAIIDMVTLAQNDNDASLKRFIELCSVRNEAFYEYSKKDFLKNPFGRFFHYRFLLGQQLRFCWGLNRTFIRDDYYCNLSRDNNMVKIWNMGDKVDILKTYGNIKGNTNGEFTAIMTFSDAGKKIFDDVWKLGNINSDIVKSLKITDEERESFAGTLTRFLHQYKECRVDDLDSIITSKTVQESFERTKGAPTEDILMLFVPYLNPQCLEGSQKIERSDYAVEVKNIDLWNLYRKWFKKTYLNLLV